MTVVLNDDNNGDTPWYVSMYTLAMIDHFISTSKFCATTKEWRPISANIQPNDAPMNGKVIFIGYFASFVEVGS